MEQQVQNGVRAVAVGPITVDEIKKGISGKMQAQIRQEFIKKYPAQQTSNEFKDSLFSNEELGIEEMEYTETRVTWLDVPKKATVKLVQAKLAAEPNSCIYRVLSDSPILEPGQKYVLQNGLTGEAFESFIDANPELEGKEVWDAECSALLLDKIANRQLVRYGENEEGKDEDEPVLFNGRNQYRMTFFSLTPRADMDLRARATANIDDFVLNSQEVEENEEVLA